MRNATREKVFGLSGIPGNPASGHGRDGFRLFDSSGNTLHGNAATDNGDAADKDTNTDRAPPPNPKEAAA